MSLLSVSRNSVMPKDYYTHQNKEEERQCDWEGCTEKGEYPAPRSSGQLNEYRWFCLKHIRIYNKEWDFFKDKSDEEVNDYKLNSLYGHRKTWAMGVDAEKRAKQMHDSSEKILSALFDDDDWEKVPPRLPEDIRNALAMLNLVYPVTKKEIKKKYKELVKIYHPDMNNNCKDAEETFKNLTDAYKTLMSSEIFENA